MIHLGHRTLRVVGKRDDEADQPPVLIVEDRIEEFPAKSARRGPPGS
jgi:hypothetical protein